MKISPLFILPLVVSISSCLRNEPAPTLQADGYEPVYVSATDAKKVTIGEPRAIVLPGKIYAYGSYLFQVDQGTGIHIIYNADPATAKKIGFIGIAGCTELAIRSGYLYANSITDLVVIDLRDPSAPVFNKRIADAFPKTSQEYPPFNNVRFVCADPSKGVIVEWKRVSGKEFNCRR